MRVSRLRILNGINNNNTLHYELIEFITYKLRYKNNEDWKFQVLKDLEDDTPQELIIEYCDDDVFNHRTF